MWKLHTDGKRTREKPILQPSSVLGDFTELPSGFFLAVGSPVGLPTPALIQMPKSGSVFGLAEMKRTRLLWLLSFARRHKTMELQVFILPEEAQGARGWNGVGLFFVFFFKKKIYLEIIHKHALLKIS